MRERKSIIIRILFLSLTVFSLSFCERELIDKYERPDWLAGKLYTQIKAVPELSVFAQCLQLTGYDTLINTSGSYTVFAPSNEAFQKYFTTHPVYKSVEDIPSEELTEMVKFLILQDAWSRKQLRTLDVFGWIDTLDISNNQPKGFKRQTLLLDKNRKYGVDYNEIDKTGVLILDTATAGWHRKVSTDSRKYAPFFYKEYFDIYNLSSGDYEFYFNRSIGSANDIYFANAKLISEELFAENGFAFIIDEVVSPLKNAYQILAEGKTNESYSEFLNLINLFPSFVYNQKKTFAQPGADLGLTVDSLFDLSFPKLVFDINSEKTKPPRGVSGLPQEVSVRYHHGILAPSDDAFQEFLSNYIEIPNGWESFEEAPLNIRTMFVNSHLSNNSIYPSDFSMGFLNGESDILKLDVNQISERVFGSNSTFIGLNTAVVPRAFKCITGPVYLNRGFSIEMNAIEYTRLLPALKRENAGYLLFIKPDSRLLADSSLLYNSASKSFSAYITGEFPQKFPLKLEDVRTLLFNHVALKNPAGVARKEFVLNMAGNYLIFDNQTGEVSGTAPTTTGFQGGEISPEFPQPVAFDADNGQTFQISNWFNFSVPDLYSKIQTGYPHFHNLLKTAGLALEKEFKYTFTSNSQYYTVFIPTAQSLIDFRADTLTKEELVSFLMLHFVQGKVLFTDGSFPSAYYETLRADEKSTPFSKIFTKVYLESGIDFIRFRDKLGSQYLKMEESASMNILIGIDESKETDVIKKTRNNAVIHGIDKPLNVYQLDVN